MQNAYVESITFICSFYLQQMIKIYKGMRIFAHPDIIEDYEF
jgi:hypothetical protein